MVLVAIDVGVLVAWMEISPVQVENIPLGEAVSLELSTADTIVEFVRLKTYILIEFRKV